MTTIASIRTGPSRPCARPVSVDAQAKSVTDQISAAIGESVATKADLAAVRADVAAVRVDMEKLELRMTNKVYGAVAASVGLVKALDWLVG